MERCSGCDKKLEPIAVVAGEKFYYQCDTCLEYVCSNCCDEDDETGTVECIGCITQRQINERS